MAEEVAQVLEAGGWFRRLTQRFGFFDTQQFALHLAATMGIYKQVDDASHNQLIELWNGEVPAWADSRESLLEEIAYVLAQSGADGVSFLKSYGQDADIEKRAAAIYFLADKRIVDAEILTNLSAAFYEDDLGLKTKAMWGYIHIEHFPLPRLEVERLLLHQDERVSALAMVYLSHANPAEAVQILEQALSSTNPRHREYACDEVGDRIVEELIPRLEKLLDDEDENVREAARCNLELLLD